VPKVVQPDRRKGRAFCDGLKRVGDGSGVQTGAILAGDHQPGVGPGGAPGMSLGLLGLRPLPQDAKRVIVE